MNTNTNTETPAGKLKAEIIARGYTLKQFAAKMSVAYDTLRLALSGKNPLTPSLQNHIEMALKLDDKPAAPAQEAPAGMTKEGIIIYKIEIPAGKVSELCAGLNTDEERAAAIEHLIHHNLNELVELGKACEWTDEERRRLGILPAGTPAPASYGGEAMKPFA